MGVVKWPKKNHNLSRINSNSQKTTGKFSRDLKRFANICINEYAMHSAILNLSISV